jgi:hypothetical protein
MLLKAAKNFNSSNTQQKTCNSIIDPELCRERHSMATANLNKSVWLVTNTTAASKYIPRRTRISIN